jgi:hypothetical protein
LLIIQKPFVAPEVMNHENYSADKADMFSLGAIYYQILSKKSKNLYVMFLSNEDEAILTIQQDLITVRNSGFTSRVLFNI